MTAADMSSATGGMRRDPLCLRMEGYLFLPVLLLGEVLTYLLE